MTTCENYEMYSHQQIWHEMKEGPGPSSQAEAVAGWRELAARLTHIRHYLDSAVGGVQESQRGAAADAAVGAMVPMRTWLEEAQRLANDTCDRIEHQVNGFAVARDSIPEVPPEPRGRSWQDLPVIDTFTTSDQEADEAFQVEQERQARIVMMAYQTLTNERLMSMAQFAPPPSGEPDLTIPAAHRSAIGALPSGGADGSGVVGALGAPTLSAAVGAGATVEPPTAVPAPTGPVGPNHSGDRLASATSIAPAVPVAVPPGGVGPGRPGVGGSRVPGSGGANIGRGGPAGGVVVPRGGSLRGVPGLGAAGGFGPSGARGPNGFGPERGAGGLGSPGSPESAARTPGMASSGATGMGRGIGAAGAGGMVPFGGVARGGEDRERQRPSYLIESDSNLLIGELPPTAPPVIGEDPPAHQ